MDGNPHRLPRGIVPSRYELTLTPHLSEATFDGVVHVEVEVVSETSEVVLNAIELDIDEAWVVVGGERFDATVALDEATERATLHVGETLPAGNAVVSLRFRGELNDKLRGFYRSTFTDETGAEQIIAVTQFEATDARRCFPCWDEPDLKAVFSLTVVIDEAHTAVSNGATIEDTVVGDGTRCVGFADTMPMSTYLVALVIGPLEKTAARDVAGTPTRIVHPTGKSHLTAFGLDVADYSLHYLSDYFALPYPGDSMDLVAIPDFAFGAMENVGCVTFRETLLLADPDHATQGELQNLVDVVAHELAHMWFGNLVTMKWWNGIWLNEAFATFMELKVTDAFRPEWERWVAFGLARTTAFDTDALLSTRPIEYPVVSPDDASAMFDVLTYEKGGAVVRMLEQYLGEDRFRAGIRKYMAAHQYGNTETTDLWDAIEDACGEPVRRIMDSWILQGGHPIVSVERTGDGGSTVRLSQERFTYFAGATNGTRFAIPLQLRIGTTDGTITTRVELLDGDELLVDAGAPVAWVVANAGGHGFYRVRYTDELRAGMIAHARVLSDIERYGLVDDTWASVLAGSTEASAFVTLAEGFSRETDVSVWRRLLAGLDQLERLVDGPARETLRARIRAIVAPGVARLGWTPQPGDSDRDRELRGALIGALAVLGGDREAEGRVAEVFDQFRRDPESVEPNVAGAVIRATAALAGDVELDALIQGFREGRTPQEEQRFLYALSDVRDPELMLRVLELSMNPEVRTQNAPFLISACLGSRDHGEATWAFIEERWDEMNERFPANSIVRMIHGMRFVSDPDLAARIEAFLADHPIPQGKHTLLQHLERMKVSLALRERESARLTAFLS